MIGWLTFQKGLGMKWNSRSRLLGLLAIAALLAVIVMAAPIVADDEAPAGNSYYAYTGALAVNESGVVAIPSRYKWSVETSWRGIDTQGNNLPDRRIMLRLYDPDQNFTALTAQMDLATAARLHHELGDLLVKKLQDPGYQQRPQLYDPKTLPRGRFKGIDKNGTAIIELERTPPPAPTDTDPK